MALIAANYSIVFSKNSRRWYLCPGLFKSLFSPPIPITRTGFSHKRGFKRFLAACGGERGEGETGDYLPPGQGPPDPGRRTASPCTPCSTGTFFLPCVVD